MQSGGDGLTHATTTAQPARRAPGAQRPRPRERDLIARWGAGDWRGWSLRAADGAGYTVLFQGRPGGSCGPDFRDAVLMDALGQRITGDIELHLSPAGWRAHGHGADPRYDGLALHITLMAGRGEQRASALASGRLVPLVVLAAQQAPRSPAHIVPIWPCADFGARGFHAPAQARRALLLAAGWARFEERVAAFTTALSQPMALSNPAQPSWRAADAILCAALAEGLGYGRDRASLRACGERLARGAAPDALLTTGARMGAIERRRLTGLLTLLDRWRESGPLAALSGAIEAGAARAGAIGAARALTEALTVAEQGAISPGRARILAFNVTLPFVVAWARASSPATTPSLAALALAATEALPGLPSNQITREMARQLGLARLPSGALAQQGLHHLWARHCREKRCASCPCAAPPDAAARAKNA